jgi:SAM-dependent methyltransferase
VPAPVGRAAFGGGWAERVGGMVGHMRSRRPHDYAEQTYASPFWVVRYPHQARFRAAVRAVAGSGCRRLLDYGAGDGRLFVELVKHGVTGLEAVAYEPIELYAEQIPRVTADLPLSVRVVRDLDGLDGERFGAITCMGVLEHMPLPERQKFYGLCDRVLAPGGLVVIDVPVEKGLSVLIKEAGRVLLKGRGLESSLRRLPGFALGRIEFDPARFDARSTSTWITYHSGFDHRLLRRELAERFAIKEAFPTPFPRLPAQLGNQEMFFLLGALER